MSQLSSQPLFILLLGVWLPVLIFGLAFFFWRNLQDVRERRDRMYMERRSLYENYPGGSEAREIRDQIKTLAESVQEQKSLTQQYFDKTLETLSQRLSAALSPQAGGDGTVLGHDGGNPPSDSRRDLTPIEIVRELSHALFTPLSRMDAISDNITALNLEPRIASKVSMLKSAVEMCYAYLGAYRSMMNVSASAAFWNPDNLAGALEASAEVYADAAQRHQLRIVVTSPSSFEGLSNIYLLAVLMPLIENAVEASQDGDEIGISLSQELEGLQISLTNPIHSNFPGDKVFERGYSTKSRHKDGYDDHQGLGLTIVQNLITSVPGARLSCDALHDAVKFTIFFPQVR